LSTSLPTSTPCPYTTLFRSYSSNSFFRSASRSRVTGSLHPASSESMRSRNFSSTGYSSGMPSTFFAVQGLTKRFGGLTAVNEVSFELKRDQLVGLIGPNGAGKTTLLRLATKILRPDNGSIVFNDKNITGLRPWEVVERGICGTFQ